MDKLHTSEQMVFQTAPGHEFIDQQSVIILNAIPNKFDQIWVEEISKKVDLSLEIQNKEMKTAYSRRQEPRKGDIPAIPYALEARRG